MREGLVPTWSKTMQSWTYAEMHACLYSVVTISTTHSSLERPDWCPMCICILVRVHV